VNAPLAARAPDGARLQPLSPFGLVLRLPAGTAWESLDPALIHALAAEHRVLVVRGLAPFDKPALPLAARRLGPLQRWSFGSVNELRPEPDTKNYLYTNRAVPLHWDGAFAGRIPRYLFFHCVSAPEVAGGETVFVDSTRVWAKADEPTRDRWRSLTFSYETRRIVHYGGDFTSRVVDQHPYTHDTVMRFAEPVDDLNPVHVRAEGLSPLESAAMITELRAALAGPDAVLAHRWEAGDVVIADNHALLHGRRAFAGGEKRHIRRVNVHGPERTWLDGVKDSIRIRRPEFMVAEIPILMIMAFLTGREGALATTLFAEVVLLFFLLFHFGDMINCLADRDLDAVYKTHLSEAVKGLGVRNVKWQLALTVLSALGLAAHLAWVTRRPDVLGLVICGFALGSQYSVGPLRLKGRGLWQVAGLWAVIFVGPMLLVGRVLGAEPSPALLLLIGSYGAMQQGIVLVNTAEDLPEDRAAGIRTTAVSIGMNGCLALATLLVAAGGAGTLGALGWMAHAGRASLSALLVLGPLFGAWAWVLRRVGGTWRAAAARPTEESALAAMRPRARWMPLWITATAWTALFAAWQIGPTWGAP
jgi:alpha-ketoglutarate-dependent taurine dioxygenase/4-hydroxybenzoate polyprenyltransferase